MRFLSLTQGSSFFCSNFGQISFLCFDRIGILRNVNPGSVIYSDFLQLGSIGRFETYCFLCAHSIFVLHKCYYRNSGIKSLFHNPVKIRLLKNSNLKKPYYIPFSRVSIQIFLQYRFCFSLCDYPKIRQKPKPLLVK